MVECSKRSARGKRTKSSLKSARRKRNDQEGSKVIEGHIQLSEGKARRGKARKKGDAGSGEKRWRLIARR